MTPSERAHISVIMVPLAFASFILLMHWIILAIWLKHTITNRNDRVPSGLPLIPVICVALSLLFNVNRYEYINRIGLLVLIFDPMNWLLLYRGSKYIIGKMLSS
jgi:hypothetical protein